jgi:hypothetical protein
VCARCRPRPAAQVLEGDLNFGAVPTGAEMRRHLVLVNDGQLPADFELDAAR